MRAADAIAESTVRRFRPIVLTAAAAVLAMIPLSCSVFRGADGGGHHGPADRGPVLTVLTLPALSAAGFRVKREGQGVSV